MNKNSMYVSLLALAVSAGAVVMATKKCDTAAATSTSAVSEKEIATMLEKNPQMIIDALQKYEQQQREAEEKERRIAAKKAKMTADKKSGAKPNKKPESAEKLEEKTLIEKAEEKDAEDDTDISCIKD